MNFLPRSDSSISFRDYAYGLFARALPICMEGFSPKHLKFQEPDYIAGIVNNLPKYVNTSSPYMLSIGGCFIHKSPLVSFLNDCGEHNCCELGDLLVLYRDRSGKEDRYNSVLFQFKRSEYDIIDPVQYYLYSRWPRFNFGRKIYQRKEQYDVTPKSKSGGGLYNFIHTCDRLRFTVAEPHPCVVDGGFDIRQGMRFEDYLANFVTWKEGREISSYKKHPEEKKQDEWSHLIWDVVEKTFDATFKCNSIGINKCKRGFVERMNFLLEQKVLECNVDAFAARFGAEDFDKACSILLINRDAQTAISPSVRLG